MRRLRDPVTSPPRETPAFTIKRPLSGNVSAGGFELLTLFPNADVVRSDGFMGREQNEQKTRFFFLFFFKKKM